MATLEQVQEYQAKVASATHLMIVGPSKVGKSHYLAQAAKAGYEIAYFDNDNGFPTLMKELADDVEAQRRVHYFNPADFTELVEAFMRNPKVQYNERTRLIYQPHTAKPDDRITVVYPNRMHKGCILSLDSWTTLAFDAVKDAAKAEGVSLLDIAKYGREIYGPSGFKMIQIAQMIQHAPFDIIVQAHPAVYEIKERPPGFSNAKEIKEADMIIKETWDVPMSSSAPNGFGLGKYFNQIGWLELNRFDKRVLSFKVKKNRVVGGTPDSEGDPQTTHSFKALFGKGLKLPIENDPERPWIEVLTAEEVKARVNPAKPAPAATQPKSVTATPATPVTAPSGGLKLGGGIKLG